MLQLLPQLLVLDHPLLLVRLKFFLPLYTLCRALSFSFTIYISLFNVPPGLMHIITDLPLSRCLPVHIAVPLCRYLKDTLATLCLRPHPHLPLQEL